MGHVSASYYFYCIIIYRNIFIVLHLYRTFIHFIDVRVHECYGFATTARKGGKRVAFESFHEVRVHKVHDVTDSPQLRGKESTGFALVT
jgi:hypothetical protein